MIVHHSERTSWLRSLNYFSVWVVTLFQSDVNIYGIKMVRKQSFCCGESVVREREEKLSKLLRRSPTASLKQQVFTTVLREKKYCRRAGQKSCSPCLSRDYTRVVETHYLAVNPDAWIWASLTVCQRTPPSCKRFFKPATQRRPHAMLAIFLPCK